MTAVNYLWDPVEQNIVRELDDSGNVIAQYTTEPALYGDVLSQRRNGEDSYYHYDGQGSTVALTNSAGDVTDTYEYSAFGEVTEHSGSTVNPFQYIGQKQYYRDEETGELSIRQRFLSPVIARWKSTDPLGLSASNSNFYWYCDNSPVENIDPSGLVTIIPRRTVPAPCGGSPAIQFELALDKPNDFVGWIVQKITFRCHVVSCPGSCAGSVFIPVFGIQPSMGGILILPQPDVEVTFFEAKKVEKSKPKTEVNSVPDASGGMCIPYTKGTKVKTAVAKFFNEKATGKLDEKWTKGGKNLGLGVCLVNPGENAIWMKGDDPEWWNKKNVNVGLTAMRTTTISWDCCVKGDYVGTCDINAEESKKR